MVSPEFPTIGRRHGTGAPRRSVRARDSDRLAKWLDELGKHGTPGVTEKKGAFGLLPRQADLARDGLSGTVDFATKGMAAAAAFDKIGRTLRYPLAIDPDIQQAIAADDPVRDELQGLSAGTALAALARPVGAICACAKPPATRWNTR